MCCFPLFYYDCHVQITILLMSHRVANLPVESGNWLTRGFHNKRPGTYSLHYINCDSSVENDYDIISYMDTVSSGILPRQYIIFISHRMRTLAIYMSKLRHTNIELCNSSVRKLYIVMLMLYRL